MAQDVPPAGSDVQKTPTPTAAPQQEPAVGVGCAMLPAVHGGGAWKVAYADFTTAMMAFFMLLWLLNVAPPETLAGLADYFSPTTAAVSGHTGSPAVNPPTNDAVGSNPSPIQLITQPGPPKAGPDNGEKTGAEGDARNLADQDRRDILAERIKNLEDQAFQRVEDELRVAIQESPILNRHSDQLLFEVTEDGFKIQLIDKDRRAMFRQGTDELYDYASALLTEIAKSVQTLPNRLSVAGHTDGGVYVGPGGTGNWELSANRANSARRILDTNGIDTERLREVIGKAGTEPLYPDQPNRIENRRITIHILREAPVVPPSLPGSDR